MCEFFSTGDEILGIEDQERLKAENSVEKTVVWYNEVKFQRQPKICLRNRTKSVYDL